ncbi:MAG: vWA domain-containing protein [Actinomycetota bacterium]
MDGFLAPAAFALGALAVPVVLMYMLKSRRPRQIVPSTFLWRRAVHNVTASRPWERLRPSVLLILQLLILVGLVLALAQPFRATEGVAGDHLVLVLDASGSMAAADGSPTRMHSARLAAQELLETLQPGGTVSIISAGPRPRVTISGTSDRSAAERALQGLTATEGPADFAEAFLLAESLETPARSTTIAIISDGGMTKEEQELVPSGAVFREVGRASDNVAITRLDVAEQADGFVALIAVSNFDSRPRTVNVRLELGGALLATAGLTLEPGDTAEKTFDLGTTEGRLVASIDASDILATDNRAYAVLERALPKRVLLATPGNVFLEALLRRLPGAALDVRAASTRANGYDLAVLDRVAPPRRLEVPGLYVAPASPPPGMVVKGVLREPVITYLAPQDPLLSNVDLSDLAVARAQDVRVRDSSTLVGAGRAPLIATWTDRGLRRAYIGFDLHESNLGLQVAFPVLGEHLLSWLAGTEELAARSAGDPLAVAQAPGATEVRVRLPSRHGVTLVPGERLEETDRTGFYDLRFFDGDEVVAASTVALSFPPQESDLEPRAISVRPDPARPGLVSTAARPSWRWALVLALALLVLEWWWAHGRPAPARPEARPERRRAA